LTPALQRECAPQQHDGLLPPPQVGFDLLLAHTAAGSEAELALSAHREAVELEVGAAWVQRESVVLGSDQGVLEITQALGQADPRGALPPPSVTASASFSFGQPPAAVGQPAAAGQQAAVPPTPGGSESPTVENHSDFTTVMVAVALALQFPAPSRLRTTTP
jgi:hypothetical protein